MNHLRRVMLSLFACCALASVADAAAKSRVWKVSDSAGLMAAAREIGSDGGLISIEPGEYELSEALVFRAKSSVNMEGSGWSTIIKRKGSGDTIVFEGSCWNCRVYGLTLQGNKDARTGSGIVFRKGEWSGICVVDYCHIDGFPESGIRFDGDPKKPLSSNTVRKCWLANNRGDQLHSYYNNDFYFVENQFGAGGGCYPRTGARLDHSSAGTYTLNYHWGNVVALRLGPGANFNRVENNRFEQSRETGILMGESKGDGCQLNIITGNTIHTNSEGNSGRFNAVEAHNTLATTFTSNQIFSWDSNTCKAKSGVVFADNCRQWIVKDNIIRHCTDKPIVYGAEDGHIVKDNILE
jgi:hypothetical protein